MKANSPLLRRLARDLPPGELLVDPDLLKTYSGDKWHASHLPDAVAKPRSTRSVAIIAAYADRHRIPLTPRGAGYGYVGGCVPIHGGIVLSLEALDRIFEISRKDFVAVVGPGVNTARLQMAAEKKGLFYPPDPASRLDCTLGGNIATNAGGPRCLKYGVTRDYVLGLEVVLANGSVLNLGARTHKNKSGFDLHRLFVGSEGLLGIVTQATLKLLPLPPSRGCIAVGFSSMQAAIRAIGSIFDEGFLPCALELADAFTLVAAHRRTGSSLLGGCAAHFIVEVDGQIESVRNELRLLERLLRKHGPETIDRAVGAEECEKFWRLRREFSYALRDTGLTKLNEDIVVPRGKLEELFRLARRLQRLHKLPLACFGHAGDGNIHVNVMLDGSSAEQQERAEACLDELFRGVLAMGGVITGEHGIGLAKMKWWPDAVSPEVRALHQALKGALDPHGILNPGKFVPSSGTVKLWNGVGRSKTAGVHR